MEQTIEISNVEYKTSFLIFRHFRRMSQQDAAISVDISTSQLYKIEQGLIGVTDNKLLEQFSKVYNVNPGAFREFSPTDYQPVSSINFRVSKKSKNSIASQKRTDELDALANVIRWRVGLLIGQFKVVTEHSSDLEKLQKKYKKTYNAQSEADIEGVTSELRVIFNLNPAPIPNVTKVAEKLGVFVLFYNAGDNVFESFDGFSTELSTGQPLIVVNSQMPSDRIRLTVAHELAHVILHKFMDQKNEIEAWKFAEEFLMPASVIKKYLTNLTLEKLFLLKKRWMVSMGSLIMRAKNLELISTDEYRRLWEMMTKTGFKYREPDSLEPAPEKPELLQKLIKHRRDNEPGFDIKKTCFIASEADYTAFNFELGDTQPKVLNLSSI